MHFIYLVIDIITLCAITLYCDILFAPKDNISKAYKIGVRLIYLIVNFGLLAVIDIALIKLVSQVVIFMLITTLYTGNKYTKCVFSIFFLCFMVVCETISMCLILIVYGLDSDSVTEIYITLSGVITALLEYLSVMSFHILKVNKFRNIKVNTFLFLVVPICSIFVIFSSYFYLINPHSVSYEFILLSVCILALLNVYFYFLIEKVQDAIFSKQEIKILKTQMDYYEDRQNTLEDSYQRIRAMKHDLNHHFVYLIEQSKILSKEDLETEIRALMDIMQPPEQTYYCQNTSLNGILNYKLFEATSKNIQVDVGVNIEKDRILDEKLLCIVLGNLLDNAIENYDNKLVEIPLTLRIYEESQNLYIKISNPFTKEIKYKNNIPVTSKKDRENHGIGLQNVMKLIEEKGGTLFFTVTKTEFTVELVLYHKVK